MTAPTPQVDVETILEDLEAGRVRAAEPDPAVPGGWRVNPDVKAAILARFADRTMLEWSVGPFTFRDRAGVPPRDLAGGPWRVVPGGTTVRSGTYLAPGVVIMPLGSRAAGHDGFYRWSCGGERARRAHSTTATSAHVATGARGPAYRTRATPRCSPATTTRAPPATTATRPPSTAAAARGTPRAAHRAACRCCSRQAWQRWRCDAAKSARAASPA